jgi:hypothetical protein
LIAAGQTLGFAYSTLACPKQMTWYLFGKYPKLVKR